MVVAVLGCKAPAEPRAPEPEPVQEQKPAPVAAAAVEATVEAPAALPPCDPNAPAEIEREEVDPDDPDVRTRGERARRKPGSGIAEKLKVALPTHRAACDGSLAGPCSATGDFDGDGKRDEVVLVRSDRGEGGLAILWGAGGAALLGAGLRCQTWTATELANLDGSPIPAASKEEIPADLGWLRLWEVWPRKGGSEFVSPRKRRVPATGALGDAILLDGGDAAVLVHRGADGWVQVHLGY